ncbi:hypothetical protein K435DRAFT_791600 [Dendrothele bispora CBS 962.96]|uniref:Uncharacterized protein n=1 Tax=Dendrothele bispora (strain CBS 962.96) TaxID=1314807 RepID=A0A4S8ML46_DENBC|nr:hypothetical protein K435DRAFT_791600 [Dendrothele bispora CBS 962.96]
MPFRGKDRGRRKSDDFVVSIGGNNQSVTHGTYALTFIGHRQDDPLTREEGGKKLFPMCIRKLFNVSFESEHRSNSSKIDSDSDADTLNFGGFLALELSVLLLIGALRVQNNCGLIKMSQVVRAGSIPVMYGPKVDILKVRQLSRFKSPPLILALACFDPEKAEKKIHN